jgi:hypothetical protein
MQKKAHPIFDFDGILLSPNTSQAAPHADVQNDSGDLAFPNTVTFSATLSANAPITTVTLEYGNEQQTCGDVTAKSYPQFHPGHRQHLMDMGHAPERLTPTRGNPLVALALHRPSGREYVSETKPPLGSTTMHNWQTLSGENLRLHYYGWMPPSPKPCSMPGWKACAVTASRQGLKPMIPIDVYVYPNYDDMRDAILYEPMDGRAGIF